MKHTIMEEFNIAKTGLLKQMTRSKAARPAFNGTGDSCRYRGKGGLCCGVGFLVTEEQGKDLDMAALTPWCQGFFDIAKDLEPERAKFYADIQTLHDAVRPENWSERLDDMEANILEGLYYAAS